jgi:Integrase core domain
MSSRTAPPTLRGCGQRHRTWHCRRACRPPESPLIINERHLNQVLTEYLRHYNTTRPHRTLGQLAPLQAGAPPPQINLADHRIRYKQVLSGLTSEYRVAA